MRNELQSRHVRELLRLRASVGTDLALFRRCPESPLRGTRWETDRLDEYRWLMRELTRVGVRCPV